jgi:putative ABC transport system permease protein
MGGFLADIRLAARGLAATPAVTLAAALTFTFGIGATTAIFSVANGLLLRPLPVTNPHDLVTITSDFALRFGFRGGAGWNYAMWERFQERAGVFDGAFAWMVQRLDISEGGEAQPVNAVFTSGGFFTTLGVNAIVGRTFGPADDVRGGGPNGLVAVISHDLWERRYHGAGDLSGTRLAIDGTPVTIVGVMRASFRGVDVGQPFDAILPFGAEPSIRGRRSVVTSPRALTLTVMLRLKHGQSLSTATAALRTMQPDILGPDAPQFLREPFVLVRASTGLSDRLRQQYQYPLVILSIVSGLVLLIVCLNIANLLLSRASARRTDLGVRIALGASRWRIARHCLAEALTLGTAGAVGGVLCAVWASPALLARLPLARGQFSIDAPIDWRVFVFTTGVSAIAVVLCGTVPAWYAARVHPIDALREAGRGSAGGRTGVMSGALVVAQVTLSIVLLAAAGLFVRTASRLADVPLGFDPAGLAVLSINAPRSNPQDVTAAAALRHRLLERISAVPGVASAAMSVWTPVGTGGGGLLTDASGRRADLHRPEAFNFVTPGWFSTYRIALQAGRDFGSADAANAAPVAIVNETFRRSRGSETVTVGSTIKAGPCSRAGCSVIGIVADTVYGQSLRDSPPPIVYVPLAQAAALAPEGAPMRITIRPSGDPAALLPSLAAAVREINPALTFDYRRVEEAVREALARERVVAILASAFGAIGLLLSGVGLYGVSAYAVTRRRAEIGIRLALGAPPRGVVRGILRRITLLVVTGVLVGIVAALWLARFVAPLLYGLAPHDPLTLFAAAAILMLAAVVAAWVPASRASRIDPADVLRQH